MHSRALGEDTESTRNSLGEIDLDGDFVASLEGTICKENQEMLERSAIAVASSSQSADIIMEHILAEGVNNLEIKPMGGMLHLITFSTFEDKKAMMESNWLEQWFLTIRNVNDHSATLWRETWLKVYGVPLIAWGYENFYKIGCVFGRVLSVNYKDYDCAHILIFTDSLFELNGKLSFTVGDNNYPVFVSEIKISKNLLQKSSSPIQPCPPQKSNEKDKSPLPEKPISHIKPPDPSLSFIGNVPQPIINEPPSRHTSQKGSFSNTDNHPSQEIPFSPSLHKTQTTEMTSHQTPNQTCANHGPPSPPNVNSKLTKSPPLKPNSQFISPTSQAQPELEPRNLSLSPIKICNKFGPLTRPPKYQNSSSDTNRSSCSGPLFPPGFENTIPAHFKSIQVEKRRRKLEKKKKLKLLSSNAKPMNPSPMRDPKINMISTDDVIDMAKTLGLVFNGSSSELRSRIDKLLLGQHQDWSNLHQ